MEQRYDALIQQGLQTNSHPERPEDQPRKQGRIKQGPLRNLLERLRDHKEAVLAFMCDSGYLAAHAFFDAWNAGDLSKTSQYEAGNFMSEAPGMAGPMNADQNRMYNQNFMTAFPDSKFVVLRTISQGDYVVVNWKASGTHTGPLQTPLG